MGSMLRFKIKVGIETGIGIDVEIDVDVGIEAVKLRSTIETNLRSILRSTTILIYFEV